MNTVWAEYTSCIEDLLGLESELARKVAAVDAEFLRESAEIKGRIPARQRRLEVLAQRNTRLQVNKRALCRKCGVTMPPHATGEGIPPESLESQIAALEYDIDAVSRSLDYLAAHPLPAQPTPVPLKPSLPAEPQAEPTNGRGKSVRLYAAAGVVGLVILVLLLLVFGGGWSP